MLVTSIFRSMAAAVLLSCAAAAPADDAPAAASPSAPAGTSAGPSAAGSVSAPAGAVPAPPMDARRVIEVLDQTIDWYRTLGVQQQIATEPRDLLILFDNRQTANQVIGTAFEIARADADLIARQPAPPSAAAGRDAAPGQTLAQLQDKFTAQGVSVQKELDTNRREAANAAPKLKTTLDAKARELQGELDLINARKSLLATLSGFTNRADATGLGSSSLKAQIDAMAITLGSQATGAAGMAPAAPSGATAAAAPAAPASLSTAAGASGSAAVRFGIWDLGTNAVRLAEKMSTLESIDRRTESLRATFADIRNPLIDELKSLSARGDVLAAQADNADSATLDRVRNALDALSSRFKQISALLIPLTKEAVLLNQYRHNLGNWRDSVRTQYHNALATLGVRVGALAALLALVFGAAEVWRHAVMRYVQDTRRRYQFMLLRRIVLWILVILIVGFGFASELGSVVTFAGLLTAGLAVAMQSVLVSIVGYFFLIGKYGIRIGDRVQVGDVTGEVIELGLVRLYLMELGGHGLLGPTGRVVAFPNSIVFQVSAGLFKQIHGVDFVWRESVFSLPAGVDYAAAKEHISAAVAAVFKDYGDDFARQSKEIQRASASNTGGDAEPRVQLQFSAGAMEAHVRYPVHLQNAAEIDERVSSAVWRAVAELTAGGKSA